MTTIRHKRGAGIPDASDLEVGEIAIDISTGTAYTKANDGSVVPVGGGGGGGGGDGDDLWVAEVDGDKTNVSLKDIPKSARAAFRFSYGSNGDVFQYVNNVWVQQALQARDIYCQGDGWLYVTNIDAEYIYSQRSMWGASVTLEQAVLGGITIGATDKEVPYTEQEEADAMALQSAIKVVKPNTSETTLEIDKDGNITAQGVVQASDYLDADGNSIIGSGGGGGDVDLTGYATETWVSANYQVKGSYAASNHNHNGVYQPAGSYAASNHNHSGVYAPVSHTHSQYLTSESDPTVPFFVKNITMADIDRWNASGGSYTAGQGIRIQNNEISVLSQVVINGWQIKNTDATGASSVIQLIATSSPRGAEISYVSDKVINNKYTRASPAGSYDVLSGDYSKVLWSVNNDGTATTEGYVLSLSDERLKQDIKTLDGSKVYQMRGVSFTRDGKESSGVVAQELQKVAPELVQETGTNDIRSTSYLAVAYSNLSGYFIEAIKDLKAEVDALKAEVEELKK